jgi:molecular chaperone DnaK (HSP70)
VNGSIGLDFGTSTTFLALSDRAGKTSVVQLGAGADPYLPSVALPQAGGFVVGEEADNQGVGVVRSIKRCITRDQSSQQTSGADPVTVEADDVIGAILDEAVRRAQKVQPKIFHNKMIRLGCPAMWDGDQRRRLAGIASQHGLDVSVQAIVDEPIAAGVGWVTEQRDKGQHIEGRVLVIDIGGGTLDVAYLDIVDDGKHPTFTVLAADALDRAGDDVDGDIAAELRHDLEDRGKNPDLTGNPAVAEAELQRAARSLKILLSTTLEARVGVLPLLGVPELAYSRAALEQRLKPFLGRAEGLVRSVLASGRLRERNAPTIQEINRDLANVTKDVSYVLLTGGTSQIPCVRDYFSAMFPTAIVDWSQSRDAQQAVALGLAGTDNYSRLNLHRPSFDLVALSPDGTEKVLYAAYTPLYQAYEIQSGNNRPGHRKDFTNASGSSGNLRIVCRDLAGNDVPIVTVETDGQRRNSGELTVRMAAGAQGFIKLYVDGQILVDAPGQRASYRMKDWPVLRSDDRGVIAPIVLEREDDRIQAGATTGETPGEPG